MRKIGVHLSISGGLYRAVEKAAQLNIQAVQIFLKNSNRWEAKPYSKEDIAAFVQAKDTAKDIEVFAHSGYLINLAGIGDVKKKSLTALTDELHRAEQLHIDYLVLHPGSHGGRGLDQGIDSIAENLSEVLTRTKKTTILLETTAGQGSSIGHRFEQIRAIMDRASCPARLGVCLDTCHIFAAGYDMSQSEGYTRVFSEFDAVIGLKRLKLIHVNDSKKDCGSLVDRHEHIGKGCIGNEGFRLLLNDSKLASIPLVLETPKLNDDEADKMNLKTLRRLMNT
ncbi:MAG TPA: deoxyribonuclease IV [Spirochaetota bacterium]|nr:deoxyribonuclease IV [Spirochaetota bacterium]